MSLAMPSAVRGADDKPYVMKIALATVNDALHQFAKGYAAVVERDSGGRIKAEIYPESRLGSTQRQAEGVQLGQIVHALRVALTGKAIGFGLYESLAILGREHCRARIDRALQRLK